MAFITRLSKSSKLLCVLCLTAAPLAAAEGIFATRTQAVLSDSGALAVSSRFRTELPDQLRQALNQGVPLTFTLSWQLSEPTLAAYKFKIAQLVSDENSIQYKLAFQPLTNRYRVSVGTFSTEYDTLDSALRGVGAVANWRVAGKGSLGGVKAQEVKAEVRLQLSTDRLPKPFQINALTSKSWRLDSGWKRLKVTRSGG
ncbi:DUF4390 domain-containing protein [Neisseria lisongii]|uniref:DUF4390 domain-containing protein n=1 Tax=Neisseria lisongii TaxID=2912188 RepID=A0AAW5AFT7_9NEIS|nr:DUF4390 domain-containing protein [Neisseria lisongii]MCF7530551.1 DUF4390 domain-containing protein [Neisseria lisongii]